MDDHLILIQEANNIERLVLEHCAKKD